MKVVIFGGTAEGRALAEARLAAGDDVAVCVTGEYALRLLPPGARAYARPMDAAEMGEMLRREAPDLVIDATHPFAIRATENIRDACRAAGARLVRHTRPGDGGADWADAVEWVSGPAEAAGALRETAGNILLTTGSHTLGAYCSALPAERLYARVLPDAAVVAQCQALGLPPGHVIAMQGPFPRALNAALYDAWAIRALVSKDSGAAGGVADKVIPALERGIRVIMIQRPKE